MGIETEMYGKSSEQHLLCYRGVVEDINDPEKAGRIKVRILGIHSDNKNYVKTKQLPWAIPATSIGLEGGGLRNIGNYKVPDIGSHVFIFFEGGDHNFPVYFACAPAIEDLEDYQEKDGKFKDKEYQYETKTQYDDKSNYSEDIDEFETKKDDRIEHPIQDFCPQTRKNTFGEGGSYEEKPPKKDEDDEQPIFPDEFFISDIRIAFDGKSNHDAPGYDGIHTTKPSFSLDPVQLKQELDLWSERKWGFNDDDDVHQYNYSGGKNWKPEYPMTCTSRNAQGEIIDLDILKERRTYIHPSKFFIEYVQLDSSRKKEDFLNESSIKKVYERQRGIANSPSSDSSPKKGSLEGTISTNDSTPLENSEQINNDRISNEITYDDIDGITREQKLGRFEERKHNPGREKTIIEDIVYRFYMSKVNETYQQDRNTRIYIGNDNLEIEHGDRNYRLHRGSHNQHIDEGNYSRIVNKGWEHLHIDEGHHFVEIGGKNLFETSSSHEEVGNPDYNENQHAETDADDGHGADKRGTDAKFQSWDFEGENDLGNQFFLIHEGYQIFRLVNGGQHFHILKGDQKFDLENGHQTFHVRKGDQHFKLDGGDLQRTVTGKRITSYTGGCQEETQGKWEWKADGGFTYNGNVTINGNLTVTGISDFTGGHQGANIDMH